MPWPPAPAREPERSRLRGARSRRSAAGIELCYQTFGDPDDEPLLLIMGLGGPMTWWDPDFCTMLAGAGFYVIRYDNRDTGRSSRGRRPGHPPRAGPGVRRPPGAGAVLARDMAADAFGLLDHLGLESAHVVGVSMGGMIAQTMAIEPPAAGAVADQHHVDHRQAHRSAGRARRCCPALLAARGPEPRGVHQDQLGVLEADRLARAIPQTDASGWTARRGDLRPRRQRRRRSCGR